MEESKDDLVQRLQGDGTNWVEIASAGGQDEASLIAGFLQSEGITAQVENVQFTEAPAGFGAMGDIRIYVPERDEQEALALLRKRQTEFENLDVDGEDVVTDDGRANIDDDAESETES